MELNIQKKGLSRRNFILGVGATALLAAFAKSPRRHQHDHQGISNNPVDPDMDQMKQLIVQHLKEKSHGDIKEFDADAAWKAVFTELRTFNKYGACTAIAFSETGKAMGFPPEKTLLEAFKLYRDLDPDPIKAIAKGTYDCDKFYDKFYQPAQSFFRWKPGDGSSHMLIQVELSDKNGSPLGGHREIVKNSTHGYRHFCQRWVNTEYSIDIESMTIRTLKNIR